MKPHAEAVARLMGKAPKTRRRAKSTPAVHAVCVRSPYRAIILAIDPGETSGWAVFAAGKLVQWGEVSVFDHAAVAAVVGAAVRAAEIAGLPIVVMIEDGFRGEQGASRPLWRKAAQNAGIAPRRVRKVGVSTWRSRLLGRGYGRSPQNVARGAERRFAIRKIADDKDIPTAHAHAPSIGHDACAAICIGAFACMSPIVGKCLPASARKASEVAA